MKLKNRNKVLIVFVALFLFYALIQGSFSIYRELKGDTIDLNVLDPSTTFTVTFNENYQGGSTTTRTKTYNQPVGDLDTPERTGYNFLGWFTDPNPNSGTQISDTTLVTGDVTYYAHWAKIVCKKASTRHSEECDTNGGCTKVGYHVGDTIYYGTIPTNGSPYAGDAYDCDVNDDGTFDPATERFYYIRSFGGTTADETSALVHFTSFDEHGQMDSSSSRGSYVYNTAIGYLPTSTLWDNPALQSMSGNVTRFIQLDDLVAACGSATSADLVNCQYFMETSRFQAKASGRAGIWLELDGNTYHRIHTESVSVISVEGTSENTARPVIQIPSNTIEDFKKAEMITVTFNPGSGSVSPTSKTFPKGTAIGNMPTPDYPGYEFLGWFTDPTSGTQVTPSTVFNATDTIYAHWQLEEDNLDYVFHIPGECNFTSTGIQNGANGNCVSTVNPTGSNIDYTESTLSAKKYIDTGVALYNATNHDKDYEIGFTITSYSSTGQVNQATLMNTKNEESPYPGLVFRKYSNQDKFEISSRKTVDANEVFLTDTNGVNTVVISRIDDEIYYSINGANKVLLNTLEEYNPLFDISTWFGAAPKNAAGTVAQRHFVGTLSNLYIKLESDNLAKVTFDENYQGAPTPTERNVVIGHPVGELTEPERLGYTFMGWFTDPNGGTQISSSTVINDVVTFYAHWVEDITITFNAGSGTVSPNTKTIHYGAEIGELPTPEYPGHTFDGWYLESTYNTPVTPSTTFTSTTQIYAKWITNATVTFDAGSGTPSFPTKSVTPGTAVGELPTASWSGHTFKGWYTDNTWTTPVTTETLISADVTFVARWVENITVTFDANGGTVSPNTKTFEPGTAIGELPTPEYAGHTFKGWYTDNTWTTPVDENTVFNSTTSIVARWVTNVTITFDADGGTASFPSKSIEPGTAIGELPTATKTDNNFDGWYLDNGLYDTPITTSTVANTDLNVIAKWTFANYVAEVNGVQYETLAAAIGAVPTTGVKTTVTILKDITTTETTTIPSNKWVELDVGSYTINTSSSVNLFTNNGKIDLISGTITSTGAYTIQNNSTGTVNISGGTVSYTNSSASENKAIENKGGTINITGGTIYCNSQAATINNNTGATLNMSGGQIIAENTYKGQAIYNNGGTVTISGTAYLENNSQTSGNGRAALHNYAGTVNILGGTMISKKNAAVKNNGTMTIGTDDGTIDITSPVMQGYNYGLETVSGYPVTIYDGIFKGRGTSNKAISNESYTSHGDNVITHTTETIGSDTYDVAYLEAPAPSVSYTVTFDATTNGGSINPGDNNTQTYSSVGPIGSMPSASKSNTSFLGWYTAASGGEKVLETTEVNDDITYYAHYTSQTTVCRPATTLHTAGGNNIGQIHSGQTLSAGDAYDCDVNGDGTYNATNERFYFLTNSNEGKAVFIFYNNTSQVNSSVTPVCNADAQPYGSNGPTTAMEELPTTDQWSNVSIYSEPRTITNGSATLATDFTYTGKAARFATLDEIKAATTSTISGVSNELSSYTFLLENGKTYDSTCRSNYWMETPASASNVYRVDVSSNKLGNVAISSSNSGVRPVIEVPYSSIDGAANIIEFDVMSPAMRTYFDNISTWDSGQSDSSHSSYDTYMTNNLNTNKCVYFENDNRDTEVNYSGGFNVYCDQPNKYDTGVTGTVNVYEFNESTGVTSNTQATYVTNNNGKLYNFIPGKVYYWESASDSTKNGYVRPTGERRIISIDNTAPNSTKYKTRNVRDLGGIKVDTNGDGTIDGSIKYGKLFRGEKIWGGDGTSVQYYTKLGITNELDLRANSEPVISNEDSLQHKITSNPADSNTKVFEIIHYGIDYSNDYTNYKLARDAATRVMYEFVKAHNNGNDNYSLYFHCRIGADRTGTLAYILEGLLGAPVEERYRDYELTVFFGLRERTRYYYNKGSNTVKFQYLKKAIRDAGDGVNEDVMTWFLKDGTTADVKDEDTLQTVTVNLPDLISSFRSIMIE